MNPDDNKYTADFFRKDSHCDTDKVQSQSREGCQEDTASELKILADDESSSKGEMSTDEEISSGGATSTDDEASSDDELLSSEDEFEQEFRNEDRLISQLYREVVDDLMASNNLRESTVNNAIVDMKQEIFQGHKKGFRRFCGIDFCKPVNCCGYLRRYAICHTGLVKKSMWKFFHSKLPKCRNLKEEIVNATHLKVVALGGGPGNDLVGFCSALQEIPNNVGKFDLIVVDINEGWRTVLPKILVKAKKTDYGSLSRCLKKKIMNVGFMPADLTGNNVFEDKNLSNLLGQADVLLMVKMTSFLCAEDSGVLINNVVDCMKPGAILVFIDHPYDGQFFREIRSLDRIYHNFIKYELSFNPIRSQSPSIDFSQAHLAILKKKIILTDESSESEEA